MAILFLQSKIDQLGLEIVETICIEGRGILRGLIWYISTQRKLSLSFSYIGVGSSEGKAGCVGTSWTGVQVHTCGGRTYCTSETECDRACPHGCNSRTSVSISREGT